MRRFFRFIIMTILSGLIFSLVISNSIDFSIEPIIGSIYDHARPSVRQGFLENLNQMCDTLKLIKERPEIEVEVDPRMDLQELSKICEKKLEGKDLFIEFTKTQIGDTKAALSNNPILGRYSGLADTDPGNTAKMVIGSLILLVLLFVVEKDYTDFLRTIGKILLTTSLFLGIIYLLPRVIGYFVPLDTSFLLQMDQEVRVISQDEVILVLLPIVLEQIFTDKLLIYTGVMFGLSLVISLGLYAKNKLITVKDNNKMNQSGPIAQHGRAAGS